MMSHVLTFLLLLLYFAGCGSAQPTGSLAECVGTRSFQEVSSDGYALNITNGWRIGQYVNVAEGTVINAIMIRAAATGITGIKIGIYSGMPSESSGTTDQLLTEITVNQTINTTGTQDVWLTLPEAYTFPKLNPPGEGVQLSYFFVFTPQSGTLSVPFSYVGNASILRKGFRYGASIQWANSYTDQGVGIGFRTNSDCISK